MMPVHDWTRLPAGIFHAFHTVLLGELQKRLNRGGMPAGYSALVEQYTGPTNIDVLTLAADDAPPLADDSAEGDTAVALAVAPPRVSQARALGTATGPRYARRTLVIRHVSDRRVVALTEIVSRANKASVDEVERFVGKVVTAVCHGLHTLVVDLFPPTARDPDGLHGLIGAEFADEYRLDPAKPLTAVSYLADDPPTAYLEPLAVGDPVPDMPLFLDPGHYVMVPLAAAYREAFEGLPAEERAVLAS